MEIKKLNPEFEDLNPETIIKHLDHLKTDLSYSDQIGFPVDIFPSMVQEIVKTTNDCLNYPIDFIASSLLFATSVSIGNTHQVEVKNGWQESGVLYLSLVGQAGTNKSQPLSFALAPINKMDAENYNRYQIEKKKFDSLIQMTKAERAEQGEDDPIKPFWKQSLISDFTPEALIEIHKSNKRGLGVFADELTSWLNNFNRYNQGSDEQFWLSAWSGTTIRINRKTSDPSFLPNPFVSVAGTIQPSVLNDLGGKRAGNGFLDRILFSFPENLIKEYWSELELSQTTIDNWNTIVSNLIAQELFIDENKEVQPRVLKFTSEAKKRLVEWNKELTHLSNDTDKDFQCGVYAKMETYTIRFSLCLEMLAFACGESEGLEVNLSSVEGAIKLAKYFITSAFKVRGIVSKNNSLIELPSDKQKTFDQLPDVFKTGEGVSIAIANKVSERSFKEFLKNKNLFENLKHGEYKKKITP